MKKIILVLCICLLLTGCTSYEDAEDKSEKTGGGYFTVIKEWNDDDGVYAIVYANDTGVKYLIYDSIYKKAITPLYNADGSLQLYEENEVEK